MIIKLKPLLNEILFGKKFKLLIVRNNNTKDLYDALLSKNTISGEYSYRLTWFNPYREPMGHVDIKKTNIVSIFKDKKLPDYVNKRIFSYFYDAKSIKII